MITFEKVKKTYPNGTVALDGVDLHIEEGEFVFVVGHSGAGKTTLMKLLLREEKPTSGTIRVGDYNLSRLSSFRVPYYRRGLGVVFQDFRLFPKMTVFENVAFAMRVVGTPGKIIRRRVPAILSMVNLLEKKNCFPRELSGGEQQRVTIARALVNAPRMIIADEPTGNLDPAKSLEIMLLLQKINELGTTVLVVTHEKELVNALDKRVLALRDGCFISDGMDGYYAYET